MGIRVAFPDKTGRMRETTAHVTSGDWAVHFVVGAGWRLTRLSDGRYLADFPTIDGAGFVLGAISQGMPQAAALKALIESQGGRVAG
jgi:hypothetical protein